MIMVRKCPNCSRRSFNKHYDYCCVGCDNSKGMAQEDIIHMIGCDFRLRTQGDYYAYLDRKQTRERRLKRNTR